MRVLHALRESGALSRGEIARRVGLSRTTLSEITSGLLASEAIVIFDTDAAGRSGSGRPAERLALDPASGQFLGVDFNHRRVNVAVADASHDIVASGSSQYGDDLDWPQRVQVAFELIDRLAAETGVHYGALQGVAVGVPGPYSRSMAPATARANGWVRYDPSNAVDAGFARRYRCPVVIDNNSRFAALAEAIDTNGERVTDLLYVRLSDGVGGGLVVGGRLVTGSTSIGGEFGHVTVKPNGAACRCGKRGCLETVASVPAILAECRNRGVQVHNLEELKALVAAADPIVDEVMREAGTALGNVLGAAAMILNPSQIVIAGEIITIAPAILQQVTAVITYEVHSLAEAAPVIRAATHSSGDGAFGAVAALFHRSPLIKDYQDGFIMAHQLSDPIESTVTPTEEAVGT